MEIKNIEIILPAPEESERTGIDIADAIDIDGEIKDRFIAYCDARGLDPADELSRIIKKQIEKDERETREEKKRS